MMSFKTNIITSIFFFFLRETWLKTLLFCGFQDSSYVPDAADKKKISLNNKE